jgi:hypothetical protein
MALTAVLTNPEFLFRVESDPKRLPAGGVYRISDMELASRLSFFLWSSIPDDELLDAAAQGKLSQPGELEKQARRMLADRRSFNLANNFAGQWLRLRNIDAVSPSANLFRDFDDNLRQAFRQETELFFDSVLREDRSVLTFLKSDYTFLNERLAKHYGISHVYGSPFRRVALAPESRRGGLLRHGSVLSVTSYATRTSPVLRGVLVLRNILGAPPPAPPPDVPALDESTMAANLPMRERLAAHRSNAACASCHRTIDPVGFSLENYDAVGKWRDLEMEDRPVDASGALPGDSEFRGVDGLEDALLRRPELFVTALTENLLVFALGRGVEYYDAPAVRKIVGDARKDGYRFSSIILGIVKSVPFQMRRAAIESAAGKVGRPILAAAAFQAARRGGPRSLPASSDPGTALHRGRSSQSGSDVMAASRMKGGCGQDWPPHQCSSAAIKDVSIGGLAGQRPAAGRRPALQPPPPQSPRDRLNPEGMT